MKRRLLLLGALLLGLSLSSCKNNNNYIDLFLYDASDTFISMLSNTLVENLNDTYTINTHDAKKSQAIQNSQIIDALAEKPKALIVNMVDRLSSSAIIQKANKTNTPVIFINREPVYNDIIQYENAFYVGTNPEQEGINQALMAADLIGNPDNLNKIIDKNGDNVLQCVFIQGEANHQDTEKRTYSCIDKLQSLGFRLEILEMQYADWNKAKGKEKMSHIYKSFGDEIEFVFSNNDDMALGAIEYLDDNELITYVNQSPIMPFPIVGVDGTDDALYAVKEGYLYGTTVNDNKKQAEAIESLIRLLYKEITIEEFKEKFEFGDKGNYIYVTGELISQKTNNL